MFSSSSCHAKTRRLQRLRWLLALERKQPVLACLLAGILSPLGLLPAVPARMPASSRTKAIEVLLAALLLCFFLWFAAGPLLATAQPVMAEVGSWPSGALWAMTLMSLLLWRGNAGARYLDRARLTLPVTDLEEV